jgi:two-component system, cell cycle sensor histidine kinase and response regulator CckA
LNDVRLALACLIVSLVVIFVTLIWLLASALNHAEHQQVSAQEALRESEGRLEQKYRGIFEEAIFGIFQSTPDGRYLSANPAIARMFGYDSPEQLIASVQDLAHQVYVDPRRREEFKALIERQGEVRNFEVELYRKDGSTVWVSANARAIVQDGVVVRYEGMNQDITERKLLEGQLLQAQKMEAVGRLAGGVAHDFNNAIGVIVGYSTLLKERISSDELSLRYVEEVGKAGQRAASLTRQLLAFSRKQIVRPTILNLNSIITEMDKMLHRLIGEDIEVIVNRDPNLGRINADLGQIEQILMNLAVNARDAMPQGGRLFIETANAELDEGNLAEHRHAKPGRYVVLSVSDTGCGMDKETQAQIFEPFFTTKGNQGTGLGLSTVYGIVKQSEGYIWVYSQKGNGTRFKIHFPRVEAAVQPATLPEDVSVISHGTETILLVEDDESMRSLTRRCLADHGYTVLDVQNGEAAIRTASQYDGPIHLLLADVVMPGISGRHLAESLAVSRPEVRCLYMSGYTADLIAKHGVLEPQVALLEKPFTQNALLRQLRKTLDTPNFTTVAAARAGSSF